MDSSNRKLLIVSLSILLFSGCQPYAGFIAGYSEDSGSYYLYDGTPVREDGTSAIAYIGGRRDVTEHLSLLCQGTHFSTLHHRPEVAVNHIGCGFEIK